MQSTRFVSIAFAVALPSLAAAQPEPPPAREGLELSVGLNGGEIQCESAGEFCNSFTEAGGANLAASYFFRPTLGIYLDLWAMSHRNGDFTFTHYVNTVGVKWRPAPILTLTGGVGAAHATLDYQGFISARATSDDGAAVLLAAALDVIRARRWSLAIEARAGVGFYGDDMNDDGEPDVVGRNLGLGATFNVFGF
ncbi:MAG: hypothetical protein SFX73_22780 [Kofleriaceae bacterium]|nr:hypothetical protein [Kofleriaceae bacterium]